MVRLKHLARLHTECTSSGTRPYVALEHIDSWTGDLLTSAELPERTPTRAGMVSIEPGDVLFGKLRPYLAKTWLVDRPALASTELLCMRTFDGVESRWFGYLTMTSQFVGWAVATSEGTKMPRTSWEKVGAYRSWLPPEFEQQAIADYLDTETGRIDALISKKRRLVELLRERRRALITAAVDPDRHNDQHSETAGYRVATTTRLKRVTVLRAGGTPSVQTGRFWSDPPDGLPWVAIGDMSGGNFVSDTDRHVSLEGIAVKRLPVGRPGTVMFAMYASLGAVAELAVTASWNQALLGIDPVEGVAVGRFVRYWLEHLRPSLGALARSNTQDNLNAEQVANLAFPVVSVDEQRAIADFLDTETVRIDKLVEKIARTVELLQERRSALITAAVTGEIVVDGSSA